MLTREFSMNLCVWACLSTGIAVLLHMANQSFPMFCMQMSLRELSRYINFSANISEIDYVLTLKEFMQGTLLKIY